MFRYDRLKKLIAESGKTKVSLCKKIKKCPTYLRDAEKQNTDIKGETLRILAQELDTTPAYLLGDTDEKSPPSKTESELSPEAKELIQLFDRASPDLRAAAFAVLRSASTDHKVQDADSAKQ